MVFPASVSKRALGGVLLLSPLSLQRFQSPSHDFRSEVEVRTVPGGNAGSQDDGLGRGVNDTDMFRDVAGKGPGVDHVYEVHRYVAVKLP